MKLTREEKAVVRAYLKMCIAKGWCKPDEYEMSSLIDNLYTTAREKMEDFINEEWEKLIGKA